jgi:flagellar hook-associated protein 3 FlgL
MRITNNMLVNNMLNYLDNNLNRMTEYQSQLATGKKIQLPSDNPVVAARALKLRTDFSQIEQYKKNAKDALSWLETTESSLVNAGEVLQRARELAVQASSGTNTKDDTMKILEEAEQLENQLVSISNSTYAGRYVFSGYKTDRKLMGDGGAFEIDVDNSEEIVYDIGIGDSIIVNAPGGILFNMGDSAVAGNKGKLMDDFDYFEQALKSGEQANINKAIEAIDMNLENVLKVRADIGARTNRIELTQNRLEADTVNFTKLMSENEDVDIAQTILNLKSEENVYKASLAGGARIIMPTLLDFIR